MKKQSGCTLIEFMVAMTIGLFCVLAVSGLYLAVIRSFSSQGAIASLEESERLAFTMLSYTIQSTGYYLDPIHDVPTTVFPADNGHGLSAGQTITGSDSGSTGSKITVRYETEPNDGIMNCLGAVNKSGGKRVFVNRFWVNAQHELECEASDGSGSTSSVVLARHIKSMHALYAYDDSGSEQASRYVAASAVSNWSRVHGVQLKLEFLDLVSDGADGTSLPPVVQNIHLMGSYERLL